MAAATARRALSTSDLRATAEGTFTFGEELPVSPKSTFGDNVWEWYDERRQRLTSLSNCELRIAWEDHDPRSQACENYKITGAGVFHAVLAPALLEDLKRVAFVYYVHASDITKGGKAKPSTVVAHVRRLIAFFGHLSRGHPSVSKIGDVQSSHIKKAVGTYPYDTAGLKTSLGILCHPLVSRNLRHPPSWNSHDLKNIRWPERGDSNDGGGYDTMPEELFRLLSNTSCNTVGRFLHGLGKPLADPSIANERARKEFGDSFSQMFSSYVERRKIIRDRGSGYVSNHTSKFRRRFGYAVKQFSDFLHDVQRAAQTVILLYTGMRYSEVTGLKRGCLQKRNGVHFLKTTLVKHVSNDLPIDYDEWLAIRVVRDAVRALSILSMCTFNRFLFSSFNTVKSDGEGSPISNSGLIQRLNRHLDRADDEGEWEDWKLHPHQFRNSLAAQLGRAEVGIPYITMQLKHAHAQFSYLPSSVTLQYGNLRPYLIAQATGITEARAEVLKDAYGENARVAGAGAAKHVKRAEDFFRGIGLSGQERDAYLEQLARSGMPVVPTGFGLCGCNHSKIDPEEEKEEDLPPCYGDYQCRPSICEHAIVTEDSLPGIKKRYERACDMIESPKMAHARKHWTQMRDNLRDMIESVEPEYFQE